MATKKKETAARKPRADAQRNRERILGVAKEAFTRAGADASLDEIARLAGVGPGTLYRHFPTRDELLEAVYRTEVEKLAAAASQLAKELEPMEAVRAWLVMFVDYIAAKKIIAPALCNLVESRARVVETSRIQVQEAMRFLVQRAVKSGELRKDLDPIDLLAAIVGMAHLPILPDWQQSAKRLINILIAGSRPEK